MPGGVQRHHGARLPSRRQGGGKLPNPLPLWRGGDTLARPDELSPDSVVLLRIFLDSGLRSPEVRKQVTGIGATARPVSGAAEKGCDVGRLIWPAQHSRPLVRAEARAGKGGGSKARQRRPCHMPRLGPAGGGWPRIARWASLQRCRAESRDRHTSCLPFVAF